MEYLHSALSPVLLPGSIPIPVPLFCSTLGPALLPGWFWCMYCIMITRWSHILNWEAMLHNQHILDIVPFSCIFIILARINYSNSTQSWPIDIKILLNVWFPSLYLGLVQALAGLWIPLAGLWIPQLLTDLSGVLFRYTVTSVHSSLQGQGPKIVWKSGQSFLP